MKLTIILGLLTLSLSTFGATIEAIKCSAGNKNIYLIREDGAVTYVNYEVNNVMNEGADVFLEDGLLLTKKDLSFSLNVDGQEGFIKVNGTVKEGGFSGVFYGATTFGNTTTKSICTLN